MDIALTLDPDEAAIDAIRQPLIAYSNKVRGRPSGYQPLALHLRDGEGRIVGGLTGMALNDWLYVELLHVDAGHRGGGHGAALMQRAEDWARERGLDGIWLDTFEYQARPFYEKLGYSVFGTIEGHPRGSRRYFLLKRFEASTPLRQG